MLAPVNDLFKLQFLTNSITAKRIKINPNTQAKIIPMIGPVPKAPDESPPPPVATNAFEQYE